MQGKQRLYLHAKSCTAWVGWRPPQSTTVVLLPQDSYLCYTKPKVSRTDAKHSKKPRYMQTSLSLQNTFSTKWKQNIRKRKKKFRTRAHLTVAHVVTETHCFLSALRAVFFFFLILLAARYSSKCIVGNV